MRRKLITALLFLNVGFAIALVTRPVETQVVPRGLFNCCQGTAGDAYCCRNCCWFISDCSTDEDCREQQEVG